MKNIPLKVRMIIAFLLIFLLPLLVIGIPGGIFITRSAQDSAMVELERICLEAAGLMEDRQERMDSYMLQASNDSLIKGIMYMQNPASLYERYSAIELARHTNQLRLMHLTTGAFDDLALCFPEQNFAMTQRGTYTLSLLFRYEFAVEDMGYSNWLAYLDSLGQRHEFLPIAEISTFGVLRPGLLYVCPMPMKYGAGTQFAVLYFLSSSSLDQAFAPLLRYRGMSVSLVGVGGVPYYRLGGEAGGEAQSALYAWSRPLGETGLSLDITVPYGEIMRETNAIRNTILLIISLMGALGGTLSAFVARINYRPLENLFSILFERGTLSEQHPTASALRNVGVALTELLNKDDYLQRQFDEHQDLIKYAVLSRLLDGSLPADPRMQESALAAVQVPLPYRYLSVGVFYRRQGNALQSIKLPSQQLQMLFYTSEQDGRLAVLFNHASEDAMQQLAAHTASPLYIGISAPRVLLSDVHLAYQEALYAVNYRPVRTQTGAVFYMDVYDAQSNYFYPAEAENRLVNLLRAGDAEGARAAFGKLLEHNLQDEPASYVLRCFLDSVAMNVYRHGGIDQMAWEQRQPRLSPDASLDALTGWMHALLDAAAEACAAREDEAPDVFLREVLACIDANLYDSQLSLSSVAERCGVSASHLSRYIKRATGIGYLDLVNRKRIVQVKELLRKGNLTIKEIAAAVGFDSDVTLRRLFKKYEGVPPTRYDLRSGSDDE